MKNSSLDIIDVAVLVVGFLVIYGIWQVFWRTVWTISDFFHGPIIPFFILVIAVQCWRAYRNRRNSN